jgi:hypothetical protein
MKRIVLEPTIRITHGIIDKSKPGTTNECFIAWGVIESIPEATNHIVADGTVTYSLPHFHKRLTHRLQAHVRAKIAKFDKEGKRAVKPFEFRLPPAFVQEMKSSNNKGNTTRGKGTKRKHGERKVTVCYDKQRSYGHRRYRVLQVEGTVVEEAS